MWQESSIHYGSSSSQNSYYSNNLGPQDTPLQFYSPDPNNGFYPGSRPSLDAHTVQGNMAPQGMASGYGGSIQSPGGWWTAFGTGGLEGEPPLLEELGINFWHIRAKSLTVLNPLRPVDERIMDDADMAGPLIFMICFGMCLLLSGRSNFGYIYGVGLFGTASLYTLLNLMSEKGIGAYRVASVLGYCLLPMVGVSAVSVMVSLDDYFGHFFSILSILWCTYSASGIFVAVLRMSEQRLLVAYPVGLLYGCFALLSVFGSASPTK
ncbi:Yip1-domain-containing protein [Pluteus cervinus]|uniref:Yip1-domain-containing protein n=1 Tax=Pluteus cervinus TaxID=181527 RepID=A0ACD3BCK7_9AGAR|nr:Yip1-domain-containing protein [Pluteus cervinus]